MGKFLEIKVTENSIDISCNAEGGMLFSFLHAAITELRQTMTERALMLLTDKDKDDVIESMNELFDELLVDCMSSTPEVVTTQSHIM